MGLTEARRRAIACIKAGSVQAENRSDLKEKNLLKTGVVSAVDVIALLKLARGSQYESFPHKDDSAVMVHLFRPQRRGEQWYIKLYFLESNCCFISVHKSHVAKRETSTRR